MEDDVGLSLLRQRLLKVSSTALVCSHLSSFYSTCVGLSFISEVGKSGPCPLGFIVLEKRSLMPLDMCWSLIKGSGEKIKLFSRRHRIDTRIIVTHVEPRAMS